MPKAKKPQINALSCYVRTTLMPELQRQGQVFPNGIADVIPIAHARFQALPPHEKARYEQMAKQQKQNRANTAQRDNVGNLIVERKDPRQMMMQKRRDDRIKMRNEFHDAGPGLVNDKFYVIGFEYMVKLEESGDFLPVEVGLVEWAMSSGVLRSFHRMISPGDIPLGYRFKCQEQSDDRHKIPLDKIAEGDRNYIGLWLQLENFIQLPPSGGSSSRKIIHCLEHEYEKVSGCLDWLYRRSDSRRQNPFEIRFLEDLCIELFAVQNKNVSESSILDMLTTTMFDYESNVCCRFHEDVEAKHCALGTARRYTFAMSDSLAAVFGFDLTPNHLPVRDRTSAPPIVINQNESRMVPEFGPSLSGRVSSVGSFGGRDIRYAANSSAPNVVDGDGDFDDVDDDNGYDVERERSLSSVAPAAVSPGYAAAFSAPPAQRVPLPTFAAVAGKAVTDKLADLTLAKPAPPAEARPPRLVPPPGAMVGGAGRGVQVLSSLAPAQRVSSSLSWQATRSTAVAAPVTSLSRPQFHTSVSDSLLTDEVGDDSMAYGASYASTAGSLGRQMTDTTVRVGIGRGSGPVLTAPVPATAPSGAASIGPPGISLLQQPGPPRAVSYPGPSLATMGRGAMFEPVAGRGAGGRGLGGVTLPTFGRGVSDRGPSVRPPPGFGPGQIG